MIVIDSSAALEAILVRPPNAALSSRLREAGELHAPHLIDVEVVSALRRLVRRGQLSTERAADAHVDFRDFPLVRYPHTPLIDRMWELRENLSAYDATFVALAETLDVPLVTCDSPLASAPGLRTRIEVFAPSNGPISESRKKTRKDDPHRRTQKPPSWRM